MHSSAAHRLFLYRNLAIAQFRNVVCCCDDLEISRRPPPTAHLQCCKSKEWKNRGNRTLQLTVTRQKLINHRDSTIPPSISKRTKSVSSILYQAPATQSRPPPPRQNCRMRPSPRGPHKIRLNTRRFHILGEMETRSSKFKSAPNLKWSARTSLRRCEKCATR